MVVVHINISRLRYFLIPGFLAILRFSNYITSFFYSVSWCFTFGVGPGEEAVPGDLGFVGKGLDITSGLQSQILPWHQWITRNQVSQKLEN